VGSTCPVREQHLCYSVLIGFCAVGLAVTPHAPVDNHDVSQIKVTLELGRCQLSRSSELTPTTDVIKSVNVRCTKLKFLPCWHFSPLEVSMTALF